MKKTSPNTCYTKVWAFAALFAAIFFVSCRKQLHEELKADSAMLTEASSASNEGEGADVEGTIILGQPNLNPYTVSNMLAAFNQVTNENFVSSQPVNIRATHYYVKFKPQNMEQYDELISDSTLGFQDYPIEATILQNGNRYHDPSLPDSVPTYQYTAVPADYQFSNTIPYEIIDDLYIPEEDVDLLRKDESNIAYVDKLLDQAYIQTGNYEDTVKDYSQRTTTQQARYTPGGRIRIMDTRLGQLIGMEGVLVTARRWFVPLRARTDFDGKYRMKRKFNRPANYSLWFSRARFTVRESLFLLTSFINGPKLKNDWVYDINDGYNRFVGHIFRAANRYHYKDIGGLHRPWEPFMRQQYLAKNRSKDQASGVNWIFLPVIKVWRFRDEEENQEYESDEIFSTTCHETGHTSHVLRMKLGMVHFWQVSSQLQESWATAIEWFITHIEYAERGIPNYGEWNYHPTIIQSPNDQGYQYWNPQADGNIYTSLFIDIVDDYNQHGRPFIQRNNGVVDDRVQDYTLPFIEAHLLRKIYGLSSLAEELKTVKPASVIDQQIDVLISHF